MEVYEVMVTAFLERQAGSFHISRLNEIAYMCISDIHQCMHAREPDWSLYRTFLAVVREGNFTAAANTLGLTQPTVGRQIESFEQLIGAKLFTRSSRGLHPTAAATDLIPHADAMASAAAALHRMSSGARQDEAG